MSACISQYVLKVCGRCDLSCDHCYVYEHADQSWQRKLIAITGATVAQAAARISEHAHLHELSQVAVVLHGGEPLLLGYDRMRDVLHTLRSVIDPVTRLRLTIHSNGVLLHERLCELFAAYDVRVGVSLDGDRTANDRHRRFTDGRSSYEPVLRALALLRRPEYRHLFAGILCTVDVANDPIAVYEALLAQDPPRLDLLLPHATWDHLPPGLSGVPAPYAAWLGRIHARWVADGCRVPIRLFDSLVAAWEGRRSGSEAVGLDSVDLLVIETDGSWEQADSLKTAYDGAPATGLDVFSHSVDEAAAHSGMAARRAGLAGLCRPCRACPLVRACGGGLYAHRYKTGSGFTNPSVYCEDLKILIPQVTKAGMSEEKARRAGDHRTRHALPDEAFDLLSSGAGDRAAMAVLADTRYSVSRALVAAVAASLRTSGDLERVAAEGWRLLSALDVERPAAVREILTYPYVGAWAVRCLSPVGDAEADVNRAHLAGLAAAAALRAGIETELALPVRHGIVYLPAVGAFAVDARIGPVARVRISASGITCPRGMGEWRTVRRVAAAGMSVTVDDIDPFRDCRAWAAAGRLPTATWQSWRRALAAAATQLAAELPSYASVIGAGLRSVVPIRAGPGGLRQSGTARQAFGAVAVALPDDPGSLCELLLHEMQHVKLTALGDLFDMFDRADDRRFRVPWRGDARPVEGVLHGTYAYLAVAELWRSRATAAPDGQVLDRYRTYRSWVEDAIETLLHAGSLLPAGERFVEGMRDTVRGWADDR
jgi:uncharacterized protein